MEGLSTHPIASWEQCQQRITEGNANRVTASTKMNAQSSRSHAALMLHITKRDAAGTLSNTQTTIQSTLHMVDLAGSERMSATTGNYIRVEELKV